MAQRKRVYRAVKNTIDDCWKLIDHWHKVARKAVYFEGIRPPSIKTGEWSIANGFSTISN